MTFTAYNTLHELIRDNHTVKQLKALTKVHSLEVISTNPNGYTPLKSDLVDSAMGLLTEYDNTSPSGFKYHGYYLLNVVFFPAIKDALLEELV